VDVTPLGAGDGTVSPSAMVTSSAPVGAANEAQGRANPWQPSDGGEPDLERLGLKRPRSNCENGS
jgi:hypothetical protein